MFWRAWTVTWTSPSTRRKSTRRMASWRINTEMRSSEATTSCIFPHKRGERKWRLEYAEQPLAHLLLSLPMIIKPKHVDKVIKTSLGRQIKEIFLYLSKLALYFSTLNLLCTIREGYIYSMNPVQRCVAPVLVKLRSSVSVEELSFAVLVIIWIPKSHRLFPVTS